MSLANLTFDNTVTDWLTRQNQVIVLLNNFTDGTNVAANGVIVANTIFIYGNGSFNNVTSNTIFSGNVFGTLLSIAGNGSIGNVSTGVLRANSITGVSLSIIGSSAALSANLNANNVTGNNVTANNGVFSNLSTSNFTLGGSISVTNVTASGIVTAEKVITSNINVSSYLNVSTINVANNLIVYGNIRLETNLTTNANVNVSGTMRIDTISKANSINANVVLVPHVGGAGVGGSTGNVPPGFMALNPYNDYNNILYNGNFLTKKITSAVNLAPNTTVYLAERWRLVVPSNTMFQATISSIGGLGLSRFTGNTSNATVYLEQPFTDSQIQRIIRQNTVLQFSISSQPGWLAEGNNLTVQVIAGTGDPTSFLNGFTGVNYLSNNTFTLNPNGAQTLFYNLNVNTVTSNVSQMSLLFSWNPSTTASPGSTDSLSFTMAKLELGNFSSPYSRPPYDFESWRNGAFYQKSWAEGARPRSGTGVGANSANSGAIVVTAASNTIGALIGPATVRFNPPMVFRPNLTFYSTLSSSGANANNWAWHGSTGGSAGNTGSVAPVVLNVSNTGFTIYGVTVNNVGPDVANQFFSICWTADGDVL